MRACFPTMRGLGRSPPRCATSTSSWPCCRRALLAVPSRSASPCTTPATWYTPSASRRSRASSSAPSRESRWSRCPTASSVAGARGSTTWCSRRARSRSGSARSTTFSRRGRTCWPAPTPVAPCRSRRSCAIAANGCRRRIRSRSSTRRSAERHFRRDGDLRVDRPVDRTVLRVEPVHALRCLPLLRSALQGQLHVDAPDHQRAAFQLHLAFGLRGQLPGGCGDLTRLQRASVGPDESTGCGGHQIVERRGVGLVGALFGAIVGGHGTVRAELHRRRLHGKPRLPQGPLDALHPDLRSVCDFRHATSWALCNNASNGRRRGGIAGAGAHPDARERIDPGCVARLAPFAARRHRTRGSGREVLVPGRGRPARSAPGEARRAVEGGPFERQRAGAAPVRVSVRGAARIITTTGRPLGPAGRVRADAERAVIAWVRPSRLPWTDPADVKRWFKPTRLIMDAKVDGLWHSEVEWQGKRWPHYGRFTRLERPRLFEQTWMSEATHGLETVVRVELEPKGGGTEVRLTHSGLPDDEAENHRKGWEQILSSLDDLR